MKAQNKNLGLADSKRNVSSWNAQCFVQYVLKDGLQSGASLWDLGEVHWFQWSASLMLLDTKTFRAKQFDGGSWLFSGCCDTVYKVISIKISFGVEKPSWIVMSLEGSRTMIVSLALLKSDHTNALLAGWDMEIKVHKMMTQDTTAV